jgi:aspartyl-tRNA(Asn)/glutamyl-tRNA(Gln) amidotransferase subunit A
MTDAVHFSSIVEIGRRYRAGTLTPRAYVEHLIERVARLDGKLNAFLHLDERSARDAADRAGAELAKGHDRGPLHGIPVGIKDIVAVAGDVTSAHSRVHDPAPAREDAFVVAKLRAAGAFPFGKLALHEHAIGGPAFDLPAPPARNPWNLSIMPGGSSSGSGAALAAGLLPAALGTDTGGSIRGPAGFCGVAGLKPTYGRVSRRGVLPLAWSLDHIGPMTRDVTDNALLLNAIAGQDSDDPTSLTDAPEDFAREIGKPVAGMRVAYVKLWHTRDVPAESGVIEAMDRAADRLRRCGAEVNEIDPGPFAPYGSTNWTILVAEAFAVHAKNLRERPEDYGAKARELVVAGAFVSSTDYLRALRARGELKVKLDAILDRHDALLCAGSGMQPCAIDDPAAIARLLGSSLRGVFNLTGHPAIAVPSGFDANGLPFHVQLACAARREAKLYRLAAAFEAADANTRRPADFA